MLRSRDSERQAAHWVHPQLTSMARVTHPAGQSCMKGNISVLVWPFGFYKVYNHLEEGQHDQVLGSEEACPRALPRLDG